MMSTVYSVIKIDPLQAINIIYERLEKTFRNHTIFRALVSLMPSHARRHQLTLYTLDIKNIYG